MTSDPTRSLPIPARALAIGAHPDDIEFGCGATLAQWAAKGCEVHLLVLTDGSKGSWDPGESLASLVTTRQTEQRAAAAELGASAVHFLDQTDGELEASLAVRERVCAVIRMTRPDVILGHDPWKRYRIHPDHKRAGELTIEAIVAARDPHFFADQPYPPHRPHTLLLFEAEVIDHYEPIGEVGFDAKVEALLRHRSQWRSTHGIDADPEREIARFRDRLRSEVVGWGRDADAAMAEAFKRLVDL
jgi:LmbE family N-acetylglucosaminyl deacetylase